MQNSSDSKKPTISKAVDPDDGQEGTAGFAPALGGEGIAGQSGTSSFDAKKPFKGEPGSSDNSVLDVHDRGPADSATGRLLKNVEQK